MASEKFTIKKLGELERDGKWLLARRSLGVSSFGMNIFELKPGEQIPEHTELERNQEEVFIVLEGDPVMVIDGREHPAPAGTMIRLDPEPSRYMHNSSTGLARVLVVSAPRTSGYEPLGWA